MEVHGTAVAHAGRALLLLGPSGSGKSRLAVGMAALGARIVADDRVRVLPPEAPGGPPRVAAPARGPRAVEVRGLALLPLAPHPPVPLLAALDLGRPARGRLPAPGRLSLAGHDVTCLQWGDGRPYPAALMLYLATQGPFAPPPAKEER